METAALVSSIVSIIIGGFAIWLSVTFYKMSNKISEDTKGAAKGISASVNRLESLFDSLYSDTFSMMKDTVDDMRKHIWPVKEQSAEEQKKIDEKADAKIDELKKQFSDELSGMMANVGEDIGRTDSKIADVEKNLEKLVDRAIQQTRKVESEAQDEKSMRDIIMHVMLRRDSVTVGDLFRYPILKRRFTTSGIIEALRILERGNHIKIEGDVEDLHTIISPPF